MIGEIRELYRYNGWANRRSLEGARALTPTDFLRDLGSSFPSVQATLVHILSAEWIWLQRWLGHSPPGHLAASDLASFDILQSRWEANDRELLEFVAGLDEKDLSAAVSYRTIAGDPQRAPLWQLMRHVVNHSTYHRGQVATLLRQLGAAAPSTDLILFFRQEATAAANPEARVDP